VTNGNNRDANYDVTVEAQRFLMLQRGDAQSPRMIVVVENWLEELKARVPTK